MPILEAIRSLPRIAGRRCPHPDGHDGRSRKGSVVKLWNPMGSHDDRALRAAVDRSLAVVRFDLDGRVIEANDNFLTTVGYRREEVLGQPHRLFMPPGDAESEAYRAFWRDLKAGKFQSGAFRRHAKGGREIWLRATYNPVLNRSGRTVSVVKLASDITADKLRSIEDAGQIAAIHRSQAVIAFDLDGVILEANANFLDAMGYTAGEIVGRHHRMFVDPAEAAGPAYAAFWQKLRAGEFQTAEYRRFAKGGREVWIRATYNPILGGDGKPVRIVKFAIDVTAEKVRNADYQSQIAAINRTQAVIAFTLDGTILDANANFLSTVGYRLDEIRGQHHRMFVEASYAASPDYQRFWDNLARGEPVSAIYQRFGKGGRAIWLQATYNPIFDAAGKPVKVVKYATDITANMEARAEAVAAAEQTLGDVESVSRAAEEMSAAVSDIVGTMNRSTEAVAEISARTEAADRSTGQMRQAAQAMDGVVQAIAKIAAQINLLALNATIESARAGEAGRGFAVVAQEVKNLANQASAATTQISDEISSMQAVSAEVFTALASIGTALGNVQGTVEQARSSIENQSVVTGQISARMHTAASGVASIARTLDDWIVGMEERRDDDRQRRSDPVSIHLPGGQIITGRLSNLSAGGAKIAVEGGETLPTRLMVQFPGTPAPKDCEIVRRGNDHIAVAFVARGARSAA
jgi:methyl-accepting chemotaxis protein